MLTSLDQLGTNKINASMTFATKGRLGPPEYRILINKNILCEDYGRGTSMFEVYVNDMVPILSSIVFEVEILNKDYNSDSDSAIEVLDITVDGIQLLPEFVRYSTYFNDKNWTEPTTHLGFNGTWQFIIPEPFWRWYHKVSGQGWLLKP